jgi:prepilin peptidase CpaA
MMANNMFLLIGQLASALGAVLLVAGALHDVAARTIPNWVSLGLFVLGVLLRLLDSPYALLTGLSLALLVFAVAVFCWRRGWLGGGDVKLLAAAAIFVPPAHVGDLMIAVTLFGGVVGLIYLLGRLLSYGQAPRPGARPQSLLARIMRVERRRLCRGGPLPYASAIAAGTIFIIFAG